MKRKVGYANKDCEGRRWREREWFARLQRWHTIMEGKKFRCRRLLVQDWRTDFSGPLATTCGCEEARVATSCLIQESSSPFKGELFMQSTRQNAYTSSYGRRHNRPKTHNLHLACTTPVLHQG